MVDGAKSIRMAGEEVAVRATIHTLGGFSAHAGQSQLLHWATGFNKPRPRLYLVHGEDDKKQVFLETFTKQGGWDVDIPTLGETITI